MNHATNQGQAADQVASPLGQAHSNLADEITDLGMLAEELETRLRQGGALTPSIDVGAVGSKDEAKNVAHAPLVDQVNEHSGRVRATRMRLQSLRNNLCL